MAAHGGIERKDERMNPYKHMVDTLTAERDALRAENERLRAVIEDSRKQEKSCCPQSLKEPA